MLKKFKEYIAETVLLNPSDQLLVAVSGGKDSVTLCHLMHKAGLAFGIVHCNFSLRGEESDEDERFVQLLAREYGVPFQGRRFETELYARQKGISIEMAARELRYAWFDELVREGAYACVVTGHHLDDQIETLLNNLVRGTGISGLHGISPRYGSVIRPLLFATRDEIDQYVTDQGLTYREDSSNQSVRYIRNLVRHQVVPVFRQINPSFSQTMQENMEHFRDVETFLKETVKKHEPELVLELNQSILISIEKLQRFKPVRLFLFEILSKYGFNSTTVNDIYKALDDISGKQFSSATHDLLKDREMLIIKEKQVNGTELPNAVFPIAESAVTIDQPVRLTFSRHPRKAFSINKNRFFANLDARRVKFPLVIRKWQRGDYFYPFGMSQKKKLSDYFIDEKFSLFEKENIWLLCAEDEIVWIIGHRIDNRFSISEATQEVLQIELS